MTDDTRFHDLRSFLRHLAARGDLAVVEAPVDARLEVAEIHRRVIAANGPALLFNTVVDRDFPLVTNLFGSSRRAAAAFGSRPERVVKRAVELLHSSMPWRLSSMWQARDLVRVALGLGTRAVRRARVLERIIRPPRLDRLPALTSWPEDGGPFLTLPLVYTEDPGGRGHNLGMYRMQIHSPCSTGMHWQIGKGGGFHFARAEARGRDLPATVFLGGPPALILAAVAPLPENVPELLFASLLAGSPIGVCAGFGEHPVVANAEFAIRGRVAAHQRQPEGPFGDHYGYYSLQHDFPVFHVDAVAHRADAIFPATVVGKPRQEDFFIGDMLQELLAPLFPLLMPAVKKLWSYGETGYHGMAAAIVRQRYRREAMGAAFRILGEGQLSLTKFLFVVDRDMELRHFPALLEHVLERTEVATDLYVISNLSMDTLDYTGPELNLGSKGVWLGVGDPVRSLPGELSTAALPPGVDQARVFCRGCVVVRGPRFAEEPDLGFRVAAHEAFADWPLVVLSDDPQLAVRSSANFLWTTFTRFEPAADLSARRTRVHRHHLCYELPVVIDARMKPSYPQELFCDPATAQRVSARWREYFPGGTVEMGDSDHGHLAPRGG